ncbi:hypothetical protein BaOVIS_001200 [Babesia ovis]|uniref:HTH OST-type domain-containing protein n=1 Tax=Babesia ovis TaxID=5869 RepID=A0A9W5T8J1_BABOV|nr:hypothetical protein BaOVIS_001200 [Babesia ovis]
MHRKGNHQGSHRSHKASSETFTSWLRNYDLSINHEKFRNIFSVTESVPSLSGSRTTDATWSTISSNSSVRDTVTDNIGNERVQSPKGSGESIHCMHHLPRDTQHRDSTRGCDHHKTHENYKSQENHIRRENHRCHEHQRIHDNPRCQERHNRDYLRVTTHTSSNVTMERRGGLTWIKGPNGMLVPYIENTWLKQMITTLVADPKALSKFLKTLRTSLKEAVLFLYSEGIKPYLGDVANQMKRSIADNFWSASEVAFVSLHCRDTVDLKIELRVKGEMGWVVYLHEDPPGFLGFVDTHSTVDPYSNYHWRALNKFAVDIMTSANAPSREGGRYAFAERLREKVYAFRSMRLGEVVHLVQLAIYSGVFVYAQRILLPVTACEKTAEEMFPRMKKVRHPICSSLDEVRRIISLLVDNRKHGLVLAQMKQQFMMQFNKELNPIMFGFRKLQNLLLSDCFNHQYQLFVPIDSPHRTHIQHRKYPIPIGCRAFQQSKIRFDPDKFWSPIDEWYDEPCDVLTTLPENIRSALEDVLDSDDENNKPLHHHLSISEGSVIDDISTDVTGSNCTSGRGMTYRNAVVGLGAPTTHALDEDQSRSRSI